MNVREQHSSRHHGSIARARVSDTHVQHVLLDDGVHDDGHQHVEEDGGQVLDAVVEVVHGRLVWT